MVHFAMLVGKFMIFIFIHALPYSCICIGIDLMFETVQLYMR